MLGFVQSWFTPGSNPIGVDFGTDSLRIAQVEPISGPTGDFKLVAAARADVPSHSRNDPAARIAFFLEAVRELWAQGNFRGRRVVLSLPASILTIQHLRVPKMDDEALKKALLWEARGKLPYDPSHAVMRHMVAGEIHQDGEQKHEVILMAAPRGWVNEFLGAAAKAKLDVVGMNVEPKAVVECFGHIYRRKNDGDTVNCFVDIGCGATRVFIAKGQQMVFSRSVPVGGDHFTRAVAAALKIGFEDAKVLRVKQAHAYPLPGEQGKGPTDHDGLPAGLFSAAPQQPNQAQVAAQRREADMVEQACREPLTKLIDELVLCRRYHEATFPNKLVDRLVFVGGEARHRNLCQAIAKGMDLAAQVGDPMVRMGRMSDIGPESGVDRRLPQPDWSVALGLSMGPPLPIPAGAK
jgi:type IV pilus assembly protein PilM